MNKIYKKYPTIAFYIVHREKGNFKKFEEHENPR